MENNLPELRNREPHKWKLRTCRVVIFVSWAISFGFTFANIYIYYFHLLDNLECRKCLYNSYMAIGIATSVLILPLLLFSLPLVVLQTARGIRIYLPFLFLASVMEFMLAVVFTQGYPIIVDVSQMWKDHKGLEFFEVRVRLNKTLLKSRYECCGVLGPDDYAVSLLELPKSCFKERSGRSADLYTTGCSTRSYNSPQIPFSEYVSGLVRLGLVLALVVYMIILKRTKTARRTLRSLSPQVRVRYSRGSSSLADGNMELVLPVPNV
ncbi:uncharacterized protein LOC108048254 isoform X1 [Drosophila rhopaloa]|uniref:Uncharacterized protein LOC108048254 isoform X1 n=1 Tax=Drosophila rhopaloa TaxID=1041015 RepID=A0A6P4F1H4_DRORH|nr:uncharacterized protein LOC108048254 isoform X1 [Drosophila rhopaloa]